MSKIKKEFVSFIRIAAFVFIVLLTHEFFEGLFDKAIKPESGDKPLFQHRSTSELTKDEMKYVFENGTDCVTNNVLTFIDSEKALSANDVYLIGKVCEDERVRAEQVKVAEEFKRNRNIETEGVPHTGL